MTSTDGSSNTINIGTTNANYRFPRYNNANISNRVSSPTTNAERIYSYGNYYTWSAAIANTALYGSNNTSVTSTSICPSGWHLPTGGDKTNEANSEFWTLIVGAINNGVKPNNYESNTTPYYANGAEGAAVSTATRKYPNNFIYSGRLHLGAISMLGSIGIYWSSTATSNAAAYNLRFNNNYADPGSSTGNYLKSYGRVIRCKAD